MSRISLYGSTSRGDRKSGTPESTCLHPQTTCAQRHDSPRAPSRFDGDTPRTTCPHPRDLSRAGSDPMPAPLSLDAPSPGLPARTLLTTCTHPETRSVYPADHQGAGATLLCRSPQSVRARPGRRAGGPFTHPDQRRHQHEVLGQCLARFDLLPAPIELRNLACIRSDRHTTERHRVSDQF